MATRASESPLDDALRQFEATEANLAKLERLWTRINELIPAGVCFDISGPEKTRYDDLCRSFRTVIEVLPAIDGWRLPDSLLDYNEIAQMRLDADEVGEIECKVRVEEQIAEQQKHLKECRFRFNRKRSQLVRDSVVDLMAEVDQDIRELARFLAEGQENRAVNGPEWTRLSSHIAQIDMLLGSTFARPPRWAYLRRHLSFGMLCDLNDIISSDWPSVKAGINSVVYTEDEPLPVAVEDLGDLARGKPKGPVATKLQWSSLTAEEFERLVFCLIAQAAGYENPEWLMHTNAPDRGRDLSVTRVRQDALGGTSRERVIIQCRHWLTKSIAPSHVSEARDQMPLWEPPRVDVLVIVTSGRFTGDAVSLIEKHNQADHALKIEMWPETHLERLLASRPALIGEFRLR
jgi:hypothetical protein